MSGEAENSNLEIQKKNKQIRLLSILIVFLSLGLGLMTWQLFELRKTNAQKGTEVEYLEDERGELQSELEEMLNEFDSLETDNDSMKVELANRRAEVEDLLDKVKDKDFAIYKLKKETTTLRTIMRGYVVTIDSINTLNVGLRKENKQVRRTLSQERSKTKELEKSNENLSSKVAIASRLDVSEVRVFGVNVRKDMTGKETNRARKTDKIRVCFQLDENQIAKAGKKTLYLRVLAPDGKILAAGIGDEYKFQFNGVQGHFSDKLVVDYANTNTEICLDYEHLDEEEMLLAGKYTLFLYAEDYEMASTTHNLK